MRSNKILIALLIPACAVLALGDSPVAPYPYITPLDGTPYYFKMIPGPNPWNTSAAKGGFYKITEGDDQVLWETKGWYSFTVCLAKDREHMVRMGMWPMGNGPSTNDVAVAFYRSGELIRVYSTLELVADPKAVTVSVSHYEWLQRIIGIEEYDPEGAFAPPSPPEHPLTFSLVTKANERITFDMKTGNLVSRVRKEPMRNTQHGTQGDAEDRAP